MARPLRRYRPGTTWHVTSRTIEERFLLALEPAVVSAIGACLARAAATYFVHVNAFVQMEDHSEYLASASP
jgi:REP element-mobilizing transposase RayT